jgi:hypothetical protein
MALGEIVRSLVRSSLVRNMADAAGLSFGPAPSRSCDFAEGEAKNSMATSTVTESHSRKFQMHPNE